MKKSLLYFALLVHSYCAAAQNNSIKTGYAYLWSTYTNLYTLPGNAFSLSYGYKISSHFVIEGNFIIGKTTEIETIIYDTTTFARKKTVVEIIPSLGITYYPFNSYKGFYASLQVPWTIDRIKTEEYNNKGYYNNHLSGEETQGWGLSVKAGYNFVLKERFLIDPYCSFLTEDIISFGDYNKFIAGINLGVVF